MFSTIATRLLAFLVVIVPLSAKADNFQGRDSTRTEACAAAKTLGQLRMENKYTTMENRALGGRNKLKFSECDCSEDTRAVTSTSRWVCAVDVEISSVELPWTGGGQSRRESGGSFGVKNAEGKGDTQSEACSSAKYTAERSTPPNTKPKSFGACDCSLTNGSSFRYVCNVDVSFEPK